MKLTQIEIKKTLLTTLWKSEEPVSGERLSEALGMSRVAVWKQLESLRACGYPIVAGKQGYTLGGGGTNDFLYPWEFDAEDGLLVEHFDEVGSTMDSAEKLGRELGENERALAVFADRQTGGRGRRGRRWDSERGGLYVSLYFRPRGMSLAMAGLLSLSAATALASYLREECGLPATVKWPNDVLIDGRKVAGILLQAAGEQDAVRSIVLGLGVNVANAPSSVPEAIGMRTLRSRKEVFLGFWRRFRLSVTDTDREAILAAWSGLSSTLGRRVRIVQESRTIEGTALRLDDHGGLVIQSDTGGEIVAHAGDCIEKGEPA